MTKPLNLKTGGFYNWKGQPERLVYLGRSRGWHQFSKVDSPERIWCEVLETDLAYFEETTDTLKSILDKTANHLYNHYSAEAFRNNHPQVAFNEYWVTKEIEKLKETL